MAYDLLKIKPAREVPPFKPAWLLWAVLFAVIVGGGAFCVARFWPATDPANTLWFWTCVAAYPFLAWLTPFFFYLGVLQVPRRRAMDFNRARDKCLDDVRRKAGVPLHVLGSAFIFSAQESNNTADAVVQKRLILESRERFTDDSEKIAARWIEPDGYAWQPGNKSVDEERHREVLTYVFDVLLRQIAPVVRALPERTKVVVRLGVASMLFVPEITTLWRDSWAAIQLDATPGMVIETTAPELIVADVWIDGKEVAVADAVTVLCVVQLNALLNARPDTGSAEAGVILVLAPAALVMRKRLASQALLFRPERCDEKRVGQGLLQALLWGRVQGPALTDQWMTGGAEASLNRELAGQLDRQGVGVMKTPDLGGQHDFDLRVGAAGVAAPWLCTALAVEHARISQRVQLVSVAHADLLTVAVIAPRR